MKEQSDESLLIKSPGYPWTGPELFCELRTKLSEEHKDPMYFDRLGLLIGRSKSTAYHWFDRYNHPHVIALFCCLERLCPTQRQAFVETHCRTFPTLEDPRLVHAPTKAGKLWDLLRKDRGLTIITGGDDSSRTFVVTAMGHSYSRQRSGSCRIAGLDLHRPDRFVPIETCTYIDGTAGFDRIRCLILKLWPRVITKSATLLLFNGVWPLAELRQDILRRTARAHVVLASSEMPDIALLRCNVFSPLHVVSLAESKSVRGGIRVSCRHVRTWKSPENRTFGKKGRSRD